MKVTHRYAGQSSAADGTLSFAPDLSRDPTYFVGTLGNTVAFREAISVLHHVVTHDLRPKPTNKESYFRWLEGQRAELLAEANTQRERDSARLTELRSELSELRKQEKEVLGTYRKAEQKYFDWLYKVDRAAWYILDPVIAVHPDELSFECFSADESVYGRLGVDLEMFQDISEFQVGVTNIDYSQRLYDAFQQMRSHNRAELRVNPEGFTADVEAGQEIFEAKIDLPDSWMRGFLQVSAAMTLPMSKVRLHPMDMHNICVRLRARKETHGPRSLRFRLRPGAPVEVVFEPWNEVLACPRSICHIEQEDEIRLWGRRRLRILERMVPVARHFDLYLFGSGMPSFVIADLGPMRFTLGLSGWTSNDWAQAGHFDLLAPRRRVPSDLGRNILDHLRGNWIGTGDEIARAIGADRSDTASSLTALAQAGRVMFDLDKGFWRLRELTQDPLSISDLRFTDDTERLADRLFAADLVELDTLTPDHITGRVTEDGRSHDVSLTLNADERITGGTCTCWHIRQNALRKGPCAHMIALRRAAEARKYSAKLVQFPRGLT
ncbi:hypothetical protein [Ruegeria sp. Ofav3-42]|uniref:hypothetical protein n=1 Tax=Ruegeria sp. Ofav3-42 TaxID=2917759 RepID=UPI001EF62FBB|nr:hypothetical protein [Ruegeria sp. Ofav3-42]MCG7521475.1 hypothetical protein [Ruegeria sp. Ofav3-42]